MQVGFLATALSTWDKYVTQSPTFVARRQQYQVKNNACRIVTAQIPTSHNRRQEGKISQTVCPAKAELLRKVFIPIAEK